MHTIYMSTDCLRGFADGGTPEGPFYLNGPSPKDLADLGSDLFDNPWPADRERTETIASVDALIALAKEPGEDTDILTLSLPLHDPTAPVDQDRFTDKVERFFAGEKVEDVVVVDLVIRRQDVREFAAMTIQGQVDEKLEGLWDDDLPPAAALARALAIQSALCVVLES